MDKYCDTSKVVILPTTKEVVYKMITKKHYAKKWTASTNIYGVYWDEGDSPFFDDRKLKLIGAVLYGHPSGFRVVKSVSEDLEIGEVLELKRLWIADGYGKNIESFVVSKTLKMLRKDDSNVKVIISFADPVQNHQGTIYQATNWIYQGRKVSRGDFYEYKYPNTDVWLSDRAIGAQLGSNALDNVLKKIPDMEYRVKMRKHRYLYFLCNKQEKKKLMKSLKHPIKPYGFTCDCEGMCECE
tara:strand:- start:79 stop:801 length:723 start_codon:yes stop_codon:yes gene_type:complete